jgi:Zn-dependent protease
MSFRDFADKVRKYAGFSVTEKREFWIAALVLGLAYSWNTWGTVAFDFWVGLGNLLAAFIIALIALYAHHFGQRLYGLHKGYLVEHKVWWYGAGVAALITLLSGGSFVFLAVTGTYITIHTIHRLGKYNYGPNVKEYAMIALMGPLANIIVAGFVKSVQLAIGIPSLLVDQFFVFNLAFAAWNLLPLPPLDGSRIVFSSRLLYALVAGAAIGYVLLIHYLNVYSWVWALAIGLVTWLVFYLTLEK